jgi:hypothetical protein
LEEGKQQLDHLGDVLAGGLARVQEEDECRGFDARGCCLGSPVPVPAEFEVPGRWRDHVSRLVDRDTGEVTWRSEPYGLDAGALRQLLALADRGWDVELTGFSPHYPGWALAVLLWPPDGEGQG